MEKTPINDGGPAFPTRVAQPFGNGCLAEGGMTLRDWFAGQVIGYFAQSAMGKGWTPRECALDAYDYADAMLAAREVKP